MDTSFSSTSLQARKENMEGNCSGRTDVDIASSIEKEHMFDKVVTPSDVGKLNRLVIPKQHAEKHFPLDSSTNEKGLLLNFEDRNGKPWRFRYSYWNSSQSYVMTKGWSKFVKEKQLDAGDVVSFERGVGELGKDRLFIDCRRRPDAPVDLVSRTGAGFYRGHQLQFQPWISWNRMYSLPYSPLPSMPVLQHRDQHFQIMKFDNHPYLSQHKICHNNLLGSSSLHQVEEFQHGVADYSMVIDSVPVVQGKSAAKRLRLFGVNMDCPTSDDELECNVLSSSVLPSHPLLPSSSFPLQLRVHNQNSLPKIDQEEFNSDKGKSSLSLDLDL